MIKTGTVAAIPDARIKPYVCTSPIVLTLIREGLSCEITIPAERAEQYLPSPFPFAAGLFSGGGGKIRIIRT